mmetsp:Transcript_3473/g.10004  ORF Transcript_3473/g.10004 Transcript_3473/m.10004 type:complete len:118 (-) Transcript_3473:1036-1389(-)
MGADAWSYRQAAMEGSYFRAEEALATRRHLERMVSEGKISEETVRNVEQASKSNGLGPQVEYRARSNLPEHQVKFKYSKPEVRSTLLSSCGLYSACSQQTACLLLSRTAHKFRQRGP